MPIPVLPWAIAAGSALLGFLLGRSSKADRSSKTDSVNEESAESGKDRNDEAAKVVKLAILGAPRVGKSVLHAEIKRHPMVTGFHVLKDVDGSSEFYRDWRAVVGDADAVLYLLKASDMAAGQEDNSETIKRDVEIIVHWLSEGEKQHLFFVVTHCDVGFPDFSDDSKREDFRKEIARSDLMSWMRRACKGMAHDLVIGSLSTPDEAKRLVDHLHDAIVDQEWA